MMRYWLIAISASATLWAQGGAAGQAPKVDRAGAYYHYTLAHMYAEQASMFGNRADFVNKAIYIVPIFAFPGITGLPSLVQYIYSVNLFGLAV